MDAVVGVLTNFGPSWALTAILVASFFAPDIRFSHVHIRGLLLTFMHIRKPHMDSAYMLDKFIVYAEKYNAKKESMFSCQMLFAEQKTGEVRAFIFAHFADMLREALKAKGEPFDNVRQSDYFKDFARIVEVMLRNNLETLRSFFRHINDVSDNESEAYALRKKLDNNGLTVKEAERLKARLEEIESSFAKAVSDKVDEIISNSSAFIDEEYPTRHYVIEREELRAMNMEIMPDITCRISDSIVKARELKMEFLRDKEQLLKEHFGGEK